MIILHTGLPGAGKTLNTLVEVDALAKKTKRPVYYSGIKDLRIPDWIEFGKVVNEDRPHETDASEWYKLPKGAIIVIDECQRLFRPRHVSSGVPEYVAKLETHRHSGYDLFLITQHPKLLDANVRRLVGRHVHFVRAFGANAVTRHEWAECKEDTDSRDDSVRTLVPYPKHAYAWYRSAEVHTHKARIPSRVVMLVLIPGLIVALGWLAAKSIGRITDPNRHKPAAEKSAVPEQAGVITAVPSKASVSPTKTAAEYVAERIPRIPSLPHTAPAYDEVTRPVRAPFPAACVLMANKCGCYTDQGTRLEVSDPVCRQIVERGFFVDWEQKSAGYGAAVPPHASHAQGPQRGNAWGPAIPLHGNADPPSASQIEPRIGYPGGINAPGVRGPAT